MSRSRRKSPIRKSKNGNLKRWRTEANRCLRHNNSQRLRIGKEDFLIIEEVSDIWTSPADGYCSNWDYWSERHKESPMFYSVLLSEERLEEIERENDAHKARWKWRIWIK